MGCTVSSETKSTSATSPALQKKSDIKDSLNVKENVQSFSISVSEEKSEIFTVYKKQAETEIIKSGTCVIGTDFKSDRCVERRNSNPTFEMSRQNKTSTFGKTKPVLSCTRKSNLTTDSTSNPNFPCIKFEVLPVPVKSDSDKKEYKVIKLENGLTACLIADKAPIATCVNEITDEESDSDIHSSPESSSVGSGPETDESSDEEFDYRSAAVEQKMAAAGLCIGVGSFSDPKDVPGMAHFLEHMVFMGSEKFPAENDFDSFIKKGGGSDNASTDTETTCFYFECLEKHLQEALDKFSQFFISPLMKKSAMTREREAIESEFQIALPSDSSRKEQLLCTFADPNSPVNSFSWGNLITLRDNISDEKLYEGVHNFRKRHYSAHRMTLAIQARLPMDTLQHYVLDCFSGVPNNNLPPDDFKQFSEGIFDTPEFTKIYYIKPTKDLCQVDLTWSLPSLRDKYKSKPHQYISHLMGDEGKGSLLSYLRKKVWGLATSIGNGESGMEHNSMYALFTVTVVLTEEGLAHLYEVIEIIFSYINLLRKYGPQERIFNEIKTISDTAFRFATEETAADMVEDLCESMQFYPPEDYIAGSEIYYEYDPKAIEMVMSHLHPEKVNVIVLSKTLPVGLTYETHKVEKWFGTKYTSIEIPKPWIRRWKYSIPPSELHLPLPNPFLTTDFTILPDVANHPDYPEKLISTPLYEMWYRKDQKFKLPLAYYYFYLISPMTIESASSPAMLDMLINLLVVSITEEVYPATSADLAHSFVSHDRGLMIKVSGYNQKLPLLIEVISKYLVTLSDHLTESMFNAVKDKVSKSYYNKLLKPSSLAKDVRLNLLVNNYWTPVEKYSTIQDITFEQVKQFSQDFMKSLYIKTLVQGNVLSTTAFDTVSNFVKTLNFVALPKNSYPRFRVAQVPNGEKCCRVSAFNKNDSNSIITNYYQSGPFSVRSSVVIEIIMLIIEEPLFDILRTKEQLGYNVYCSIRDTFGILGYTLTVNAQATKFTTSYVDERIEHFLKHTSELLSKITEKELNLTKGDLIKTKQCTDVHLKEEIDRNWSEIIGDDYMFDRLKQEIDAIGDVKINEVRDWWNKHNVFGSQENYRKISIQVVGHNINANKDTDRNNISSGKESGDTISPDKLKIILQGTEETSKVEKKPKEYFINDIEGFKRNLFLYPTSHKI